MLGFAYAVLRILDTKPPAKGEGRAIVRAMEEAIAIDVLDAGKNALGVYMAWWIVNVAVKRVITYCSLQASAAIERILRC